MNMIFIKYDFYDFFYITTAFKTLANYSSNFWMTARRTFIIELIETRFFL